MTKLIFKKFTELSTGELYDILQLRSEVFVVEQNCVYQDLDDKDDNAIHLMIRVEGVLVGYARIFKPGDYFTFASIGRIVVKNQYRKFGIGHKVVSESINFIQNEFKEAKIKISAQTYLKTFYKSHRFEPTGKEYLEDGIPHLEMIRDVNS